MANRLALRNLLFSLCIIFVSLAMVPWSEGLNQPSLVTTTSTQLKYHKGPLLAGPSSINIYLIWYGAFSPTDRTTITSFFSSFDPSTAPVPPRRRPTISTWWKTTQSYKDVTGKPVSGTIKLAGEVGDINYSLGKNIKRAHVAVLVKNMIVNKVIPFDPKAIYLVLTAADVTVEQFCMGSCGFHGTTLVYPGQRVVYAHVGDPHTQCPGLCAWPYSVPMYGPPGPALVAPNSVGVDGMVINIATVVAGAATNPLNSGYYQGDALSPLEAVSACAGIFGSGAYPGYPGALTVDRVTKASYNAYGMDGRKYLLPAMWDPLSQTCKVVV